ncbi:MAG TPA: hypothetical protein VGF17_29150, partial [Phytomonospora sp.]
HLSIIGGKKRPVLRRSRDKAPADRLTSEVLRTLFARRREVPLGQYNKAFGAAWKMLRDGLEQWRRDPGNGLWEPSGTFRRRIAAWSGLAAALTGIVLVAAAASGVAASDTRAQVALGAGLAGAGLAALFFAWELRVRTPLGARLWSETEAYRRHLAGLAPAEWATGNRAAMSAWAVALGLTAPLRAASADAGTSASGVEFRPDVALGLQAVAVQTATPPSSSDSSSGSGYSGSGDGGSSGGGDSGGGGGGDGGGGSW